MQRMNLSAVLLFFAVHLTTPSLAAESQIDEHTGCSAALHAFEAMRALSVPLSSEPAKLPPPSEGNPRFRNQ